MKKTFQNIATKLLLLVSFFCLHTIAWADTGTRNSTYTYADFFSQGWVWGVIALMIGLVVAAMYIGKPRKDNEMINE